MKACDWDVRVDDMDGQLAHVWGRESPPTLLLGVERRDNMQRLYLEVSFSTIEQAERAGRVLQDAMRTVDAIQAETPARVDDGHEHRLRSVRYSRAAAPRARCELCDADLGELPRLPRRNEI